MPVTRISLSTRLERVNNGLASDPQFLYSAVHRMAKTPLCFYMAEFPEEYLRLLEILGDVNPKITYQEAAYRIWKMLPYGKEKEAGEAEELLSLPIRACYEKRKGAYGKKRKS